MKPPLASLPKLQNRQKRTHDRIDRVSNIRDQLMRKKGKRPPPPPPALEPGNGDPSLAKRVQLNRPALIRCDLPVAVRAPTNRAERPQEGKEIDPALSEGLFVFPNRGESVNVGYLNLWVPGSRGVGPLARKTFGLTSS